jgi:hypothetical protein
LGLASTGMIDDGDRYSPCQRAMSDAPPHTLGYLGLCPDIQKSWV